MDLSSDYRLWLCRSDIFSLLDWWIGFPLCATQHIFNRFLSGYLDNLLLIDFSYAYLSPCFVLDFAFGVPTSRWFEFWWILLGLQLLCGSIQSICQSFEVLPHPEVYGYGWALSYLSFYKFNFFKICSMNDDCVLLSARVRYNSQCAIKCKAFLSIEWTLNLSPLLIHYLPAILNLQC